MYCLVKSVVSLFCFLCFLLALHFLIFHYSLPASSYLYPSRFFSMGRPRSLSGKESTCQYRRPGFDPWIRKIPWRRKWQPTPVFLPGESHGQRSLAGYSPWGRQRVRHDLATKQQQHIFSPYSCVPTHTEWLGISFKKWSHTWTDFCILSHWAPCRNCC